jgi:hypothetical protein
MKHSWIPVAAAVIFLAGATQAFTSQARSPLPPCKLAGYTLLGEYSSDRLDKGKIVHTSKSEELPEQWSPNGNYYANVRIESGRESPEADLRAQYSVDRQDGKIPGKKTDVILTSLAKGAPVSLFDFSKIMPAATEFPARLRVQVFTGKTPVCETVVEAASLD